MKPNLNLSIPLPCREKWENFISTPNGGHCNSCNKVVVDFTRMDDVEILAYFKNKSSNTCGRFRPDQMKTYTIPAIPKVNPGFVLLKAGLLSLVLLLISKPSSAQKREHDSITEVVSSTSYSDSMAGISPQEKKFTGIVRDLGDGAGIPGVNVILKGTTSGTSTDADGRFEFPEQLKEGDVLVFTFIGYKSKELTVNKKSISGLAVPLELCMDVEIMGEVSVNTVYTEGPSGFLQWMRKIKRLF